MESSFGIQVHAVDAASFTQHNKVHALLLESFAYMDGRVDPPSSIHRLDLKSLIRKVAEEQLFIALKKTDIIGCVFAAMQPDSVYLGKLAVSLSSRGKGVARQLIQAVEQYAASMNRNCVDIETRVELIENQQLFEHVGYVKYAENAHEGYTRTTSFKYRKVL